VNFPENLRYTKDHEWIRTEGNEAFIGITDFAQRELGDIVFVEINALNEFFAREAVFGTVEAVKTVSDLFMPVSGTILEINPKIQSHPEVINKDPYTEGWLIKISLADAKEANELLSADDYKKLVGK